MDTSHLPIHSPSPRNTPSPQKELDEPDDASKKITQAEVVSEIRRQRRLRQLQSYTNKQGTTKRHVYSPPPRRRGIVSTHSTTMMSRASTTTNNSGAHLIPGNDKNELELEEPGISVAAAKRRVVSKAGKSMISAMRGYRRMGSSVAGSLSRSSSKSSVVTVLVDGTLLPARRRESITFASVDEIGESDEDDVYEEDADEESEKANLAAPGPEEAMEGPMMLRSPEMGAQEELEADEARMENTNWSLQKNSKKLVDYTHRVPKPADTTPRNRVPKFNINLSDEKFSKSPTGSGQFHSPRAVLPVSYPVRPRPEKKLPPLPPAAQKLNRATNLKSFFKGALIDQPFVTKNYNVVDDASRALTAATPTAPRMKPPKPAGNKRRTLHILHPHRRQQLQGLKEQLFCPGAASRKKKSTSDSRLDAYVRVDSSRTMDKLAEYIPRSFTL